MSVTNSTTMVEKITNWVDDNPSDFILVLSIGIGLTILSCVFFGVCLYAIARKTVYERVIGTKHESDLEEEEFDDGDDDSTGQKPQK